MADQISGRVTVEAGTNLDSKVTTRNGYLASPVVKRSLVVGGHKTSVSLEDPFWNALRALAQERKLTLSTLVGSIDVDRKYANLSSAIRLFVLEQFRAT